MDFARIFQEARERTGLTQAEVAERTGIARPNIAAYEAGRREPQGLDDRASSGGSRIQAERRATHRMDMDEHTPPLLGAIQPVAAPDPRSAPHHHHLDPHLVERTSPDVRPLRPEPTSEGVRDRAPRRRTPDDIESIVDGLLLTESFDELVLPRPLRAAWQPLLDQQTATSRTAA